MEVILPFFVFFLGIFKRVLLLLLASIRSVQTDVNRILLLASCFTDNHDGRFVLFRAWIYARKKRQQLSGRYTQQNITSVGV